MQIPPDNRAHNHVGGRPLRRRDTHPEPKNPVRTKLLRSPAYEWHEALFSYDHDSFLEMSTKIRWLNDSLRRCRHPIKVFKHVERREGRAAESQPKRPNAEAGC